MGHTEDSQFSMISLQSDSPILSIRIDIVKGYIKSFSDLLTVKLDEKFSLRLKYHQFLWSLVCCCATVLLSVCFAQLLISQLLLCNCTKMTVTKKHFARLSFLKSSFLKIIMGRLASFILHPFLFLTKNAWSYGKRKQQDVKSSSSAQSSS